MKEKLIILKRYITAGNAICLLCPASLVCAIAYLYTRSILNSDDVFVLLLLLLASIGTTLAVSNMGKRGISWIQGATLIGTTTAMFAACGLLSSLPHSGNMVEHFNVLLNGIGITSLNGQWTLFVIFILLTFAVAAYVYLLGVYKVGVRSHADDELRKALIQRIYNISDELDWSILSRNDPSKKELNRFTPLDVSVEKREGSKNKKQYADLMKCIRKNRRKGRVFLLKGDPGSGKSVALRKLSVELSIAGGAFPIYINLKKWKYGWEIDKWEQEEKQEKIRQFVIESFKDDLIGIENRGVVLEHFLEQINKRKCFFLMDSFDEMPCFLGSGDIEPLIADISKSLYFFLVTNAQGGIVASREYHSPSNEIGADVVLFIQEFDEVRIHKMIHKYLPKAGNRVWEMLKGNENMLAICRNPFHLTLLINYMMDSIDSFPGKQLELYEGFINHSLQSAANQYSIEKDLVIEKGTELAVYLQDTHQYESPLSSLPERISQFKNALFALEKARICRLGNGEDPSVTFSHRRFQEYFLVSKMVQANKGCDEDIKKSIVGYTDTRDAYVLYCDVADSDIASQIAAFCWKTILDNRELGEDGWDKETLVNTLFFMADAFRLRHDAIMSFIDDFENELMSIIGETEDFMVRFALINCMVLFRQEGLHNYIIKVLDLENQWYDGVAMNNCRRIKKLGRKAESAFYNAFHRMTFVSFFKRFHNMHFALSISKELKTLRFRHGLLAAKYICEFVFFVSFVFGAFLAEMPIEIHNILENTMNHSFWLWKPVFEIYYHFIISRTKVDVLLDELVYGSGYLTGLILYSFYFLVSRIAAIIMTVIFSKDFLRTVKLSYKLHILDSDFYWILSLFILLPITVLQISVRYFNMLSILALLTIFVMCVGLFDDFRDRTNHFHIFDVIFPCFIVAISVIMSSFRDTLELPNLIFSIIHPNLIIQTIILVLWLILTIPLIQPLKYLSMISADSKLISEICDLLNQNDDPCLDRTKLSAMLSKLKTNYGKVKLTERLIEKHVKLQGSWPDDFYIDDKNDKFAHNMAILDWKDKPAGTRIL